MQLCFDVPASAVLSETVKRRLLTLAGRRADSRGVITIEARSHRSQHRNREDARQRLAALIERAHQTPRQRIATQPGRTAKRKRVQAKRRRSVVKSYRQKPGKDD